MITLFEKPFLHEGHIGSCWSSFFLTASPSPTAGLISSDREGPADEWNENLTDIRFFKLLHNLILTHERQRWLTQWDGVDFRLCMLSATSHPVASSAAQSRSKSELTTEAKSQEACDAVSLLAPAQFDGVPPPQLPEPGFRLLMSRR